MIRRSRHWVWAALALAVAGGLYASVQERAQAVTLPAVAPARAVVAPAPPASALPANLAAAASSPTAAPTAPVVGAGAIPRLPDVTAGGVGASAAGGGDHLASATASGSPASRAPAGGTPAPAPLTLDQALALADTHSRAMKVAGLLVPKARAALDRAQQAADAGGAALARALEQHFGAPLPANESTGAALRRSAELGLQQAVLGTDAARQSMRMAVTRAYLEWRKAAALADAQGDALARARAQAGHARAGVAAGSAAPYDVLQADAAVAAQKAAVVAAGAGRASARLALERVMGTAVPAVAPDGAAPEAAAVPDTAAPATSIDGTVPGTGTADSLAATPEPEPAEASVVRALQHRPEVALADLSITVRQSDLDLLARHLPAGDPGLVSAGLALQEAALQLESVQDDVRTQVRQAWLALNSARERLVALQQGEAQAREALRLARLRFDAGAATSLEVVSAQAGMSQATASRIQAAADVDMARASLRQAAGDL